MNTFKKSLIATSIALTLPVVANVAQAFETSANVTLTTDYKFRGISQTNTNPAIQGGFDVAFDSGLYVGTWGSNVDFDDPDDSDANMELDYYFGFGGEISESLSYDIGYIYYDYPGSDTSTTGLFPLTAGRDLDYQEVYASMSFNDLTVGFAYSDDYWLETGNFYYVYADYGFELPGGFGLGLHYGYNDFEFSSDDSKAKDAEQAFLGDGEDSYSDYSISLSKSYLGLDFALSWVDTDLDEDECWGTDWCDSSVVFSVSKSM
ncbi:TorF family putative porin [Porticoccus sp.]